MPSHFVMQKADICHLMGHFAHKKINYPTYTVYIPLSRGYSDETAVSKTIVNE